METSPRSQQDRLGEAVPLGADGTGPRDPTEDVQGTGPGVDMPPGDRGRQLPPGLSLSPRTPAPPTALPALEPPCSPATSSTWPESSITRSVECGPSRWLPGQAPSITQEFGGSVGAPALRGQGRALQTRNPHPRRFPRDPTHKEQATRLCGTTYQLYIPSFRFFGFKKDLCILEKARQCEGGAEGEKQNPCRARS